MSEVKLKKGKKKKNERRVGKKYKKEERRLILVASCLVVCVYMLIRPLLNTKHRPGIFKFN